MEEQRLRPGRDARPLRLLIIDDSADDAELMREALQDDGWAPLMHRVDAPGALAQALEREWDIMLCDYSLPQLAPDDVVQRLRAHVRPPPLVIVSGEETAAVLSEFSDTPAQGFVSKQELGRLPQLVRDVLERPAADATTGATGVYSWRELRHRLDERLARAEGRKMACLIVDVDAMRQINHGFGFERGELLLEAVERRVVDIAGPGYIGRSRGDEFVLLVGLNTDADATALVNCVMAQLREPYALFATQVFAPVSAGLALFPEHATDAAGLVREAENALYDAKRLGGNRPGIAMPATSAQRALRLEDELPLALERGQFHLEYQPQVELRTGELMGVEALLRWDHPVLGRISPARFIPVAEETGAIVDIGAWVIHTACVQAGQWHTLPHGHRLRVAVNLSMLQFLHGDLTGTVEGALCAAHLPASALDLELTESVLIREHDKVLGQLETLRDAGIRVAVDDFGTGYSSLSYIRRLPLDVLKIDRSFVTDMVGDPRARAVVATLVQLGVSLNMEVIAEGVERASQLWLLRDLGCQSAQGFLLGPPCDSGRIGELLGQNLFDGL